MHYRVTNERGQFVSGVIESLAMAKKVADTLRAESVAADKAYRDQTPASTFSTCPARHFGVSRVEQVYTTSKPWLTTRHETFGRVAD